MITRIKQAVRGIFLLEFVSAFWLAMKYFFRPKITINYPFEKVRYLRVLEGSMLCAATRRVKSAALRVSSVKRFALRRPSQLKPNPAQMGHAAPRVMTLIWSNAFIVVCVRRLVLWTRLLKDRITNLRQRPEKSFITIKKNFSLTVIVGNLLSPKT